jgi:hypothetical protein
MQNSDMTDERKTALDAGIALGAFLVWSVVGPVLGALVTYWAMTHGN